MRISIWAILLMLIGIGRVSSSYAQAPTLPEISVFGVFDGSTGVAWGRGGWWSLVQSLFGW